MTAPVQTEDQAVALVMLQAAGTQDPLLDAEADVRPIVRRTMLASVWQPNSAYIIDQEVAPSVYQGRVYRCKFPGLSGPTEPTWLWTSTNDETTWTRLYYNTLNSILDGQVIWVVGNSGPQSLYDVRAATYDAWLLKAGRCANRANVSGFGQSFSLSALHAQCIRMAGQYLPARIT